MPVILVEKDWPAWLEEVPATDAELLGAACAVRIGRRGAVASRSPFGNVMNNGPELVTPIKFAGCSRRLASFVA
jgi:putative SOS response-associated peptidase YedK